MSFNRALGLRAGAEPATVLLTAGPEHEVAPGTVHFAVLATLAEVAAAASVGAAVVPTTVQIHLMRRAASGELTARGALLRQGRRLAVAEGEVRQDERLVAKATVTFALLGGPKES